MMAKISFLKEPNSLRPIAEDRRYREAAEKLARFQAELRELRAAVDRENAFWYARQASSLDDDAIGRADRMLDGAAMADDRSTAAKLHEIESKIAVLRPAIGKQHEVVDRIRGELSAEAGKAVQARHRKAIAGIFLAARHLAEAAAAERVIRRELLDLGFEALDAFTPAPRFAIPLTMGDESWPDSAISFFRRQLEELGIPT